MNREQGAAGQRVGHAGCDDNGADPHRRRHPRDIRARRCGRGDGVGRRVGVFKRESLHIADIHLQTLRPDFGAAARRGVEHFPRIEHRAAAVRQTQAQRRTPFNDRHIRAGERPKLDGCRRRNKRHAVRPQNQRQGAVNAAGDFDPEIEAASPIQRQRPRGCRAVHEVLNAADAGSGVKPGGDARRPFQISQQARRQRHQTAVPQVQHAQAGCVPEKALRQTGLTGGGDAEKTQVQIFQPRHPGKIIRLQGRHRVQAPGEIQRCDGREPGRRNGIADIGHFAVAVDKAHDVIAYHGGAVADGKALKNLDGQRQIAGQPPRVGRRQRNRIIAGVVFRQLLRRGNHARCRIDCEQTRPGQRVCHTVRQNVAAKTRLQRHARHRCAHRRGRENDVGR